MTKPLVRQLLKSQLPALAHLSLTHVASGWDNVMFRLGDEYVIRLPRRAAAAPLLLKEQLWLPLLQPHLSLPIPAPIFKCLPDADYPWPWSVLPWLEGEAADVSPPHRDQGTALAQFFHTLHMPAPHDAPHNAVRGVPLRTRETVARERITRLREKTSLVTPLIEHLLYEAIAAPIDMPPTWIHGDLHARNVLVNAQGTICGVIDWGDMCAGDRATDLAAIWMLLPDAHAREDAIRVCTEVTPHTWTRARGWAVLFGVLLLDAGLINDSRLAAIGAHTLQRLEYDESAKPRQ